MEFTCKNKTQTSLGKFVCWNEQVIRQEGDSHVALVIKNPPVNAGDAKDLGSVPESERPPGEGNGNHFSILAWKNRYAEEPGQL